MSRSTRYTASIAESEWLAVFGGLVASQRLAWSNRPKMPSLSRFMKFEAVNRAKIAENLVSNVDFGRLDQDNLALFLDKYGKIKNRYKVFYVTHRIAHKIAHKNKGDACAPPFAVS